MIRVWSLEPGPNQFRVVGVLYDQDAGNFASVAWQPDGHGLVTGDRRGHVKAWDFDPASDGFDAATIARSEAPIAAASADAEPPPGVGSDDRNAASRSVTLRSTSFMRCPRRLCRV